MRTKPRYERDHSAVQRDCSVYLISVLDWRTDYRTICEKGYVGETITMPFIRFMEQLYDQEFGDTIVGTAQLLGTYDSKEEALAAEKAAVEELLPQMNHEWQPPDNPNRVPIFDQKRMREERDAARDAGVSIHDIGHSGYELGGKRGYVPRSRRAAGDPHPVRARRPAQVRPVRRPPAPTPMAVPISWQRRAWLGVGWLVLAAAMWAGLWQVAAAFGWVLPSVVGAPAGFLGGGLLVRWWAGR